MRVTSRPPRTMRPAEGRISPESWATSVVFPAPFGPITACVSPAASSRSMASLAVTPPKRFVSPCTSSSGRGLALMLAGEERMDAALVQQDDEQHQGTEDRHPVLRQGGQDLFEDDERRGPDRSARNASEPAQDDHDEQVARELPVKQAWARERIEVGIEGAAEPREGAGEDERDELVAVGVEAERLHAALVVLDAAQDAAEPRTHDAGAGEKHGEEDRRDDVKEEDRLVEVEHAKAVAGGEPDAVVAAEPGRAHRDVVQHLGEG